MKKYDWHELKSNMKIFAVIDTNVLVSALMSRHADSATVLIMDYISGGDIVPIYNEEILQEYYSVLSRDKFKFPKNWIETTICSIMKLGIHTERVFSGKEFPDHKDVVFYEVSLSIENTYLVTGNIKHFPKDPFVVTPAEMIHIVKTAKEIQTGLLNEPSGKYLSSNQQL